MTFVIGAKKRTAGNAEETRAQGQVPGVLYGPDMQPVSFSVGAQVFQKMYAEAGRSSLVDVSIDAEAPVAALIQDVQYDPVSGRVIHIDFRQINLKKVMHAAVALVFVSEAPAVKGLGGTLVKALDALHVSCLPQDLVGHLDVDISVLKTFENIIRVGDIAVPTGMTVTDDPNTTVAKVLAPFTEEQLKAMEEQGPKSLDEIEVAKKEKKEGDEEGEEGASGDEKAPAEGKEEKSDKGKKE